MNIHQVEQSILFRTLQSKVWAIRPEWISMIHGIVLSHFFDKENKAQRILEAEEVLGRKLDNSQPLQSDIRNVESANIQVIPIHGIIGKRMNMLTDISGGVSTQKLQDDINISLADSGVDAIVLDIESPGGDLDFTKETADFIYEARKVKPIVAFANGEMASAAYYIGSAASKVLAYDSALVGSIGVYVQHVDMSKYYEQDGIKVNFIRSKPLKAVPNRYEPLEGKKKDYVQALVDDAYQMFVGDVAHYRDESVNKVENEWGTGAIFTAQDALDMGLIDEIVTSLDDAVEIAASMVSKKGSMTTMSGLEGREIDMEAFTHNSTVAKSEPSWGSIDKTKLPRIAHAEQGEPDKKSSWGYPHHWVSGGKTLDKNGVYTDGTMYLHKGGLNAAWAAANGARSGQEASASVKAHLQAHRKALGLDKAKGEQEDIELLGEQDQNIKGGDNEVEINFSERLKMAIKVFKDGEKSEISEDASVMLTEVQAEVERLEGVETELKGKITTLEAETKKYQGIPDEIRTKIEDTTLTWAMVSDYVKVCQKELDSICTDLGNAAVASLGNEAKIDDLKAELLTKAKAFGLEAAIGYGRSMIKAYQDKQTLNPGQKSETGAEVDEEKAKEEALVARAKENAKKFNISKN